MKKTIILITVVIIILSFVACGSPAVQENATQETVVATPTEAPTAELTAEPTPKLSPTPEPTVDPQALADAELNQQMQDFLNNEGEYTAGNMSLMMIKTLCDHELIEEGLGIANGTPLIEGYFLDYIERDEVILMIMGFDDNDGERFITPVEIQSYFFEGLEEAVFEVVELERNVINSNFLKSVDLSDNKAEMLSFLNTLKGSVLALHMNMDNYSISDAEHYGQIAVDSVNERNDKLDLSFKLFSLVDRNGLSYRGEKTVLDGITILKLETVEGINNIDISKVPIVVGVTFFDYNK